MEELTDDNISKSTVSSDEGNFSPVSSLDERECTKDLDYRIACSNSRSLDMIARTVSSHVTQLANSLNLGDDHSKFISRINEIFKDTMQENVTVNGLPYAEDKDFLDPEDNQVLTTETKEALLSTLSKKMQDVCNKRKLFPKEFTRIHKMRLQHNLQNLKKASVTHKIKLPSVTKESFQVDLLSSQKLEETSAHIKSAQTKLADAIKELKDVQKNIEYAKGVASKEDSFSDTGYISS